MRRYDGNRIYLADRVNPPTLIQTATNYTLRDVWGFSMEDVWTVGDAGTVLHYQGSERDAVDAGSVFDFYTVWGTSSSDIWIAGDRGVCLHYGGSGWLYRAGSQ